MQKSYVRHLVNALLNTVYIESVRANKGRKTKLYKYKLPCCILSQVFRLKRSKKEDEAGLVTIMEFKPLTLCHDLFVPLPTKNIVQTIPREKKDCGAALQINCPPTLLMTVRQKLGSGLQEWTVEWDKLIHTTPSMKKSKSYSLSHGYFFSSGVSIMLFLKKIWEDANSVGNDHTEGKKRLGLTPYGSDG